MINDNYDVAIIGAGASGLMAAHILNNKNIKTTIIDSNTKIGKKIKISGGGKCNITNRYLNENKYLGSSNFIKSIFDKFDNKNLINFLNKNNIHLKLNERLIRGSYFCNSSDDIIRLFSKLITKIHLKLNIIVEDVNHIEDIFEIKTSRGLIYAKKVIVASGGKSFPSLGASEIGYKIAQNFGHNVFRLDPALVGFTVQKDQFWFKELSGISLGVRIMIKNKIINANMLFTHKGCSGPAILVASLYWTKGSIKIDFLPNKNKYLPKKFLKIAKQLDIDIHNYIMAPAGNYGYTKAEVTKGGIDTNEINKLNFESILQKNLYFIGEVLDVTGELGGYNFQWAFSSGYVCASSMI